MVEHDLHRHLEISDSDGMVAAADVTIPHEADRTARASLRSAAGHLAPGARARLVDAVLDLPELGNGARLEVAFPLGGTETLHRLRERCTDVTTHPAGPPRCWRRPSGPANGGVPAHKPPSQPSPPRR